MKIRKLGLCFLGSINNVAKIRSPLFIPQKQGICGYVSHLSKMLGLALSYWQKNADDISILLKIWVRLFNYEIKAN